MAGGCQTCRWQILFSDPESSQRYCEWKSSGSPIWHIKSRFGHGRFTQWLWDVNIPQHGSCPAEAWVACLWKSRSALKRHENISFLTFALVYLHPHCLVGSILKVQGWSGLEKYCSWHWLGTCLLAPAVSGGSTLTDACSMLFPSPSTIMTSKPGWHRRPDTHPVLLSRRGLTSNALWFQFKKGWSWCVKAGSEEQCIPWTFFQIEAEDKMFQLQYTKVPVWEFDWDKSVNRLQSCIYKPARWDLQHVSILANTSLDVDVALSAQRRSSNLIQFSNSCVFYSWRTRM